MWQSLRLSQKIWLSLSILVLGYFGSMLFGFVLGQRMEVRLQTVSTAMFPAAMQSQLALAAFNEQITLYSQAVLSGDKDIFAKAGPKATEVKRALQAIFALKGLQEKRLATVQDTLQQMETFTMSAQTVYAAMSGSSENQNDLTKVKELTAQAAQLAQQTEEIRRTLQTFTTVFADDLKTEVLAIAVQTKQNRYLNLIVFVAVVISALLLIRMLVNRNITRPIAQIVATANAVAAGNFQTPIGIQSKDEIGALAEAFRNMNRTITQVLQEMERVIQAIQAGQLQVRGNADLFPGGWGNLVLGVNNVIQVLLAPITMTATALREISKGEIPPEIAETYHGDFNEMKANLNVMIRTLGSFTVNIRNVADLVASGSHGLNAKAAQLSKGASQQATTAEEVSSTMEQMTANIRQNAENAAQTEKIAVKSAEDARDGGKAVAQTVAAMKEITQTIHVIEEIASQTHMLSLNATIEAAKAEEYGKGFGVVAAEVRGLAARSQEAATKINQVASTSITIAEQAGAMLSKLVPNIEQTALLVKEISAASNEQKIGTEQINLAIQQLDQVIQQNVAISEETADTAEDLSQQAKRLQNTIAFFKLMTATPQKTPDTLQELVNTLQTVPDQETRTKMLAALETLTTLLVPKGNQAAMPKENTRQEYAPQPNDEGRTNRLPQIAAPEHQDPLDQEFERY